MSQTFSHGYALFVGVGNTDYPGWSLPVTVKDAQALVSIFTDPDFCSYPNNEQHIRFLHDTNATCQAILDGLDWLELQAVADSEATIVVYFSGHGWLDTSTGLYYLIPYDVKPHNVPKSALSAQTFTDALRPIQARRLLVVIDSCHAEGMATAKDETQGGLPPGFEKTAPPGNIIDALKQGKGRAVFTSSRGTQFSYIRPDQTMSIYTYHLVEALRGAGNQVGDTEVRLSNLMNHLGKAVPASTQQFHRKEQTPFFDAATEDFVVALLQGGKGLPVGGWDGMKKERDEVNPFQEPTIEIIQQIEEGKDIIGLKAKKMRSGEARISQDISHAHGIIGAELDTLG
jgi:Caspase domain